MDTQDLYISDYLPEASNNDPVTHSIIEIEVPLFLPRIWTDPCRVLCLPDWMPEGHTFEFRSNPMLTSIHFPKKMDFSEIKIYPCRHENP